MIKQLPPESLVKTWIWMMTQSEDEQIKEMGKQNLIKAFGSLKAAQEHVNTSR